MEVDIIEFNNRRFLPVGIILVIGFTIVFLGFHDFNESERDSAQVFQNLTGEGTDQSPYRITNLEDLNSIRQSMNSTYIITKDIDASNTESWDSGKGFEPIGTRGSDAENKSFEGKIRGNNYTISNLRIHRPERKYTGLFGHIQGSVIKNLEIKSAQVTGHHSTGILAGETGGNVEITNVEVSGKVRGGNRTGGLVGNLAQRGVIDGSFASTDVEGNRFVGGLTGYNQFNSTVKNSHSKSDVTAEAFSAGGLSGRNEGSVINSASRSTVKAGTRAGGLVGDNLGKPGESFDPVIRNSYSDSQVDGTRFVGLFVGFNGLDIELLQIDEKGYEVRIEDSHFRDREGSDPIGRNKGDYTDLTPTDSEALMNRQLLR